MIRFPFLRNAARALARLSAAKRRREAETAHEKMLRVTREMRAECKMEPDVRLG